MKGENSVRLTEAQQKILDGGEGEVMAKVMKTLVRYGEIFGAEEMVPVTGSTIIWSPPSV